MTIIALEQKTPTGQTFKPSQLPNIRGTPRKAPQEADNELTNEIRARVAKAMNSETLLCPIDNFLGHYGPYNVDPNDVKECKAVLFKAGLLEKTGRDYRWSKYQTQPSEMAANTDPDNTERTEPKIFAHLFEIVQKIYSYAGARRGNKFKFELVPYRYLMAAIGGTNHKMDACIVEEQTPGKLDVSTGIAPHEFKVNREATSQIDVRQQIVGDCQHIMCDDPRRMFIFGVTIEDAFFSLYYFSRSHSVKALAFNWLTGKGIDKFIEIYLAFAFAEPADLGVDPHVRKAAPPNPNDDEGQQYIYELPVQGTTVSNNDDAQGRRVTRQAAAADMLKTQTLKYFKTVHEINQMRPYCISGRTTRIWVVIEVKSFDDEDPVEHKHVILKDVWLEADKPTEAENMVNIFEDIEKRLALAKEAGGNDWMAHFMQNDGCFAEFDQETKHRLQGLLTDEKYKSLFLTKMHAWKGRVSKEVSTSAKFSRQGVDIFAQVKRVGEEPKGNRVPTKTWTATRTQSNPSGPPKEQSRKAKDPKSSRRYAPRQQSRFVYKEVCLELADVKTMGNFMHVINQALDALRILFCAGWVHRDVSEGNILTYIDSDGEWKAKLSDLEFSEKLGYGQSRTDPRTGTPYYMPHEMLKAEHLLNIHRECDVEDSLAVLFNLPVGSPEYERLKDIDKNFCHRVGALPANATKHIPDYDAAVRYNFQHDLESLWWLVLFYITKCVGYQPSEDYAEFIFQKTLTPSAERSDSFTNSFKLSGKRFLHPKLKETFKDFMEKLRAAMYEEYVAREAFGQLNTPESYSYIHGLFAKQVTELLQHNNGGWKDVPISR